MRSFTRTSFCFERPEFDCLSHHLEIVVILHSANAALKTFGKCHSWRCHSFVDRFTPSPDYYRRGQAFRSPSVIPAVPRSRTSGTGLRGNPDGFFKDGPRERKATEPAAGPTASFSALDWLGRAGFFSGFPQSLAGIHRLLSFPPFPDHKTSGTGLRGNPDGFFKDGPRERKAAEPAAGPTASFPALDWLGRAGFFSGFPLSRE